MLGRFFIFSDGQVVLVVSWAITWSIPGLGPPCNQQYRETSRVCFSFAGLFSTAMPKTDACIPHGFGVGPEVMKTT